MVQIGLLISVTSVIIQLILHGVLPSQSFAQDWAVRVKPRGTIKVVDLFIPSASIHKNYAEGFVILDKENNYVPGLAEDWRWIDEKTIEFKLRLGVPFRNGEAFDAETVRVNWEAYKAMETPTVHGFLNLPDDTILEIPDRHTVRFILPDPDGLVLTRFLEFAQFAPAFFKKSKFDEMNWGYLPEAGPWATGAFKLVKGGVPYGRATAQVVLESSENYWDRRYPKVKRVIFDNTLIGDRKKAMELCGDTEGLVDIVSHIRPLDTLKIAESRFAGVIKSNDVAILWGLFNQRKRGSKWRDVRLRKAVNYAINRNELFEYAAKGNAYNLEGFPLPPGAFGYNPNLIAYTYDTQKARSLLAKAGYPEGFEVKLLTLERLELEARIVSKMLERVGIKVTLDVLTYPEAMSKTYIPLLERPPEESNWDIAFFRPPDWCGHSANSILVWETDQSHWRWIEYDIVYEELWKDVARTLNRGAQEEKIRKMVKHSYNDAFHLFIYSPLSLYAVNKGVDFIPQKSQMLRLKETSVTENHWSLRGRTN
jgi:peptide/nickel transport system substrate-binding protein